MRISDWSSDVCSSDLATTRTESARLFDTAQTSASSTTEEGRSLQSSIAQVQDLSSQWSNTLQTQFGMTQSEADKLARDTVLTGRAGVRSEEHTSELPSLMRISYAVFCLKKKTTTPTQNVTK